MTQRIELFIKDTKNWTSLYEPLLNMTQRVEVFFQDDAKNWTFLVFQYDSKNWTFFFKNVQGIEPLFYMNYFFTWLELNSLLINTTQRVEFFTKNDSKCWTPFWIWLKELNLFCIGLKELNFFFNHMTQRIEPCFVWVQNWIFSKKKIHPKKWLKELNLFETWLTELNFFETKKTHRIETDLRGLPSDVQKWTTRGTAEPRPCRRWGGQLSSGAARCLERRGEIFLSTCEDTACGWTCGERENTTWVSTWTAKSLTQPRPHIAQVVWVGARERRRREGKTGHRSGQTSQARSPQQHQPVSPRSQQVRMNEHVQKQKRTYPTAGMSTCKRKHRNIVNCRHRTRSRTRTRTSSRWASVWRSRVVQTTRATSTLPPWPWRTSEAVWTRSQRQGLTSCVGDPCRRGNSCSERSRWRTSRTTLKWSWTWRESWRKQWVQNQWVQSILSVSNSCDCEHNKTASGDVRVRSVSKRTGNPHHDDFHSEFWTSEDRSQPGGCGVFTRIKAWIACVVKCRSSSRCWLARESRSVSKTNSIIASVKDKESIHLV